MCNFFVNMYDMCIWNFQIYSPEKDTPLEPPGPPQKVVKIIMLCV
jgi:hypothetical protein